jgi:hypothetical protein|tara:strand:- start:108 stop:860 length:753 start_codon:yes stop_codon:yes gene_type:complete
MNLDEIRKRMDRLQNKSNGGSGGDFRKNFWKPPSGEKSVVRIVPYKHNKDVPFTELYFYFGIGKPRMMSLSNFDEPDPILEFASQLRKSNEPDNIVLAKKLYPKMRIFAPVLVRGEEDKGVRFWEFGKMVYTELLGVMMDEDYGDITDISAGRDITVEVIPAKETGKMFDTTTVRVKPVQTPISKDSSAVEEHLNGQKDVKELFTKYPFDEMKQSLQKYLAPSEENETVEKTAPVNEKVDINSKIDDLFG